MPDMRFKNSVYCEIQRDLSVGDRLDQNCVNSSGKGLNVTDIHLCVKVPYCRFISYLQIPEIAGLY